MSDSLLVLPTFEMVPISRDEFLETGLACVGLDYSDKGTFIEWDAAPSGTLGPGVPRGHANCYGLPFAIAERLGLVKSTFWKALNRQIAQQGEALTLRDVMKANLRRERKTARQPGDILLFRWKTPGEVFKNERERLLRGRHHVAIDAGEGRIIHALDTTADLKGGVFLSQLNAHDWTQLHQVWSLPQFQLKREVSLDG